MRQQQKTQKSCAVKAGLGALGVVLEILQCWWSGLRIDRSDRSELGLENKLGGLMAAAAAHKCRFSRLGADAAAGLTGRQKDMVWGKLRWLHFCFDDLQ